MDMDYTTYAQIAGLPYMPTPEEFYPEMRGGMQQFRNLEQGSGRLNNYQSPPAPGYSPYQSQGRGMEYMSDLEPHPCKPVRQFTGASEYRSVAREQRRAKEMMSRNGLFSPVEASRRYSGGDANHYPNYTDGSMRMEHQSSDLYW